MRQDRQFLEHHVAVGVVEMAVRVDQHPQRLIHRSGQCIAELARETWILLSIDDQKAVRCLDRAGVGIAARSDPGMDARRYGYEMGFVGTRHGICIV